MTHFSWLDYTIFGAYLTASVGVGLFSARGSKSLGDYFLAGRGMNSAVAMSILAALFSGISYLAGPADAYAKTASALPMSCLAFFIATPFTAIWMMPKFYQSRSTPPIILRSASRSRTPARLRPLHLPSRALACCGDLCCACFGKSHRPAAVDHDPRLRHTNHALYRSRWHEGRDLDGRDAARRALWRTTPDRHRGTQQDSRRTLVAVPDTALTDGRMDISFSFSIAERVNIYSLLTGRGFPPPRADGHRSGFSAALSQRWQFKRGAALALDQTLVRAARSRSFLRHRPRALRLLQDSWRSTDRRFRSPKKIRSCPTLWSHNFQPDFPDCSSRRFMRQACPPSRQDLTHWLQQPSSISNNVSRKLLSARRLNRSVTLAGSPSAMACL